MLCLCVWPWCLSFVSFSSSWFNDCAGGPDLRDVLFFPIKAPSILVYQWIYGLCCVVLCALVSISLICSLVFSISRGFFFASVLYMDLSVKWVYRVTFDRVWGCNLELLLPNNGIIDYWFFLALLVSSIHGYFVGLCLDS